MTQDALFEIERSRPTASAGPRFTPYELARLLGQPPPTRQQAEVISAPVQPLLVVAGAGSGKTETMASRVVWLVANGQVRPEQVLGLTFTRKAAGELAHRLRQRLSQLVRRLGRDELIAGEPTVATYHSYAARVVAEHGLRAGYEPSTRLLTEAACWQLADGVVCSYDGDMSDVLVAPTTVTEAVLRLAAELAEHLRTPAELAAWTGRFFAEVDARSGRELKSVRKVLDRQRARLQLLPLVRAYTERKLMLEAMDFGDQLARAARVATDHPEVGAIERERFRVVLLDEYQDTSHAQVVLLRELFGGGHPVTAVGDPAQSIYGWRGASAGTLDRFPTDFRRRANGAATSEDGRTGRDLPGEPARELTLTTSWRNRPEILVVANALSAPLGHRVATLTAAPRYADRASTATVHCALLETYADEAAWLAGRVVAAWRTAAGASSDTEPAAIALDRRPTTAVLVRTRAQIPALESALRERGVPVEVVGLGGLLDTPEVRDVVSTLRVLADPTEGAALLRLLTGPRWRIGPRDLVALHRRARDLAAIRIRPEPLVYSLREDQAALVEALDDLGSPDRYSTEGYRRYAALAAELGGLRRRLDQPLPDLIGDVERTIGLDVEVAVRAGDAGLARGHLDALGDVAARFAGESEAPTLSAFLAFLAAAEAEERGLTPGEVAVVEGAVQILTAHAAKGLEWDVVAVAGLTANVFPGRPNGGDHWLYGLGTLPFPLRGDRDGLPELDLSRATDQRGVLRAFESFEVAWESHDEHEERRLAYVAVTRPRRLLLASGYWWGEGTKRPRGPSPFLVEIRDRVADGAGEVDVWVDPPVEGATNPTTTRVPTASWPADPLGSRRTALEEGAALVRTARAALLRAASPGGQVGVAGTAEAGWGDASGDAAVGGSADDDGWASEVDLLLAERDRLTPDPDAPVEVTLPAHLSVSQLVTLRRDPDRLARALRRPLPERPAPQARRGTAFHRWLEQRYAAESLLDLDELPGAGDVDAAPDADLDLLRARFLTGEWADRVPLRVEVPFATVVGGLVIRGRMDAVFSAPDGTFDVVDWKTGTPPTGTAATAAAVQLAAYRLAWAALAGVPVDRVRAAFGYVRTGLTVRPADLLDEAGLAALITGLPIAGAGSKREGNRKTDTER
ncbi:MAG: ATP-dependent helicase UvrD/PcrA [Micromonosporaceae bacterium]|nr:ATP-dependent helicase UvrD/PcrA [Micromonosporaceae bacterium]